MSNPETPEAVPPVASPARHAPVGSVPQPDGAGPRANWKVAAGWCFDQVRRLAPVVWRSIRDAGRYYWGIREPLKEYICGFVPDLLSPSVRQRQVKLAPYESHPLSEFGPDGWKLSVPGRCVVCGELSQIPPTDETLAVDDASRAFWTPAIVMLFGFTIGWFLFGRVFALLSIPVGFAIGYMLRTRVPVRMRLVRCDAHVRRTNIPQVLAWGNTLVVRFGHKTVRQIFRYGELMDTTTPQAVPPSAEQPASPPPQTIPLSESPHPDDATIRHEAEPTYDVEGPDSSQ